MTPLIVKFTLDSAQVKNKMGTQIEGSAMVYQKKGPTGSKTRGR